MDNNIFHIVGGLDEISHQAGLGSLAVGLPTPPVNDSIKKSLINF